MDDNLLKTGFMAVFAVSGSVVFLAVQAHKRLLSDFMKKMEFEIHHSTGNHVKGEAKKKVTFADDVEFKKAYHKKNSSIKTSRNVYDENLLALPENWQVMYKGILKSKNYSKVCN